MEKSIRFMRRWGALAAIALASCGGGGDAGPWSITLPPGSVVTDTLNTNPSPGGSVTLLLGSEGVMPGTYVMPSTSDLSGMLLVHPDGHTLATAHFQQTNPLELDGAGTTLFAGILSPPNLGASGTVTFVFTTPKALPQVGTATASLSTTTSNGTFSLLAWLSDATVNNPFGPQTYAQVSVSPALHLLPMGKLAGHYVDVASGQDLQITPDGTVSGTYTPGCAVGGALVGYDPETTLFRMSASLSGTGCAPWLQGTREYLGNLGASDSGRLMLNAYAISGSTLATLVFSHSQQLGTY
jgi:hypothetical protein